MDRTVWGYCRVSSVDQNLDRQKAAMLAEGIDEKHILCDKASGKDFERRTWNLLVGTDTSAPLLRKGDLLVVLSLDRLGRNYTEIRKQWAYITTEIGADIKVLDMPLLDTRRGKDLIGTFLSDVVLQVLSNDVETAFLAKEVALLASDPDEGDVVYCYVPMQDDPVQMRAAGDVVGKLLTMEISMIVSNVANVTAVISPEGLVRRKELEKYALVTHSHVIADIQGLQELLNSHQNSIDLLTDLISGDMPGGINFALDFAALSNVSVADGVWNKSGQYISA